MPKFDFDALSPADFEELVRDLLQAEWGVALEAFKEGRDGGIDLRYAPAHGGTTIVQCKRYGKSGFSKLLANLRNHEHPKVQRLAPQRYVIATSVRLTPLNKDAIVAALDPFIVGTADVLGADDLEGLLGQHEKVVRANFKLWLTSTEVLDRVLHNAELSQTDFEVERVHRKLPLFVQSEAFPRARELLAQTRIAIISGPPGIGKTTLAEMLLYAQLEEGYQPVVMQGEVAEGKRLFNKKKKQIFYYDDFLGQTFLGDRPEYLGKNEDAALVDFIEMVRTSDHSRFVLTTREHILVGAVQISERLEQSQILLDRCVLTLDNYTLGHRARILYNHLYFSTLPASYKAAVLVGDFFLTVIKHEHFSPRLIEWLSAPKRLRQVKPENYSNHIVDLLDNPEKIWSAAYRRQISNTDRHILLCLYTLGGRSRIADLEPVFIRFHQLCSEKYRIEIGAGDFRRALQALDGSFLLYEAGVAKFLNPSVRDFMASVILNERNHVQDLLNGAIRFRQVSDLWTLLISHQNDSSANIISSERDLFYASLRRLMLAPTFGYTKKAAGGHEVNYIDSGLEARVEFLAKLAERQRDSESALLAVNAAEALVKDWTHGSISFYFALSALEELSAQSWFLGHGGQAAYRKILSGILQRLSTAKSDDWIKLSKLPQRAIDWTQSDDATLSAGLREYQSDGVVKEERNCADLTKLNQLKVSLETLTERNIFDFKGVIQRLDVEISGKEAAREQPREDVGYVSTMAKSILTPVPDDDVQQMFATLIEH